MAGYEAVARHTNWSAMRRPRRIFGCLWTLGALVASEMQHDSLLLLENVGLWLGTVGYDLQMPLSSSLMSRSVDSADLVWSTVMITGSFECRTLKLPASTSSATSENISWRGAPAFPTILKLKCREEAGRDSKVFSWSGYIWRKRNAMWLVMIDLRLEIWMISNEKISIVV